jgi:RND family efflux transporter MFP subunit
VKEVGPRPLPAAHVADIGDMERRRFPGRARAAQEVDLSFRVQGPLITMSALVGDRVGQGGLLARIDPRDFEVRLRNAESELQKTKANLERASSEYKRLLGIREKKPDLVSDVHVERAKASFLLAKADTAALAATVEAAQDELKDTYLKAPFDGTVVATHVENYEYVQARQSIARLLDSRRIEFVFNVSETMISLIPYVENTRVRFDAFPNVEVPAEIFEIGTEASSLTRTYPVTLIMDQPEGIDILPGMSGEAMGVARLPDSADQIDIVVPVTAIFSPDAGDASYVWVIDEAQNTVARKAVVLGRLIGAGVEVESGLNPGDLIAIAGVNFLAEGQIVRPIIK